MRIKWTSKGRVILDICIGMTRESPSMAIMAGDKSITYTGTPDEIMEIMSRKADHDFGIPMHPGGEKR